MDTVYIGWAKPFAYDSEFGWTYLDFISTNGVAQEFNFSLFKFTLGELNVVVVGLHRVQNLAYMRSMLCSSCAVNEDVINVYHHILSKKGSKHVIHGCLKGSWSICKPKSEDFELVVPKRCAESCFAHIFRGDANLVVT